jgi:CBS domain-containing protein
MAPESFKHGSDQGADEREPVLPVSEPGNRRSSPEGERSNWGPAGVVSDPDSRRPTELTRGANPGAPGPEQRSVQVHEVMTRNVEVLRPDNTLEEAAEKMKRFDIGPLPVCDGDKLVGMITDRDIIVRSVAQGEDPTADRVRDVMTPGAICCCFEDQDVTEAARLMREKQVHQLPVLNRAERLVGIVSLADLARSEKEG